VGRSLRSGTWRCAFATGRSSWDEPRVDRARRQLLAKIELGLWRPGAVQPARDPEREPTFRELATDWLVDRRDDPALRPRTIEHDTWQLTRYLLPAFGDLAVSAITPEVVKRYCRGLREENFEIEAARQAGTPLPDARSGQPLRPLSNRSINATLNTLAVILDDALDAGLVDRNSARGRRTRERVEHRKGDVLEPDEFLSLLEAAGELDYPRHKPHTLERAADVRRLRDQKRESWSRIAQRSDIAPTTAMYLYGFEAGPTVGIRRAIIATLELAGLRVSELCALDAQDLELAKRAIHVRQAKTSAGVRAVDIRPRLVDELGAYLAIRGPTAPDAPAFPSRTASRRDKDNIRVRVLLPALDRANELRAREGLPPIRAHVTPQALRRTYITFMLAAGFDLPYVQDQVGHRDPAATLRVYAQVLRRLDRDRLRTEMRELLGEGTEPRIDPEKGTKRHQDTRKAHA
jgi:integrase